MANVRLARFITEVAPPQFVTVMRQRTVKMLDTIKEEEIRDTLISDSLYLSSSFAPMTSSPSSSSSSSSAPPLTFAGRNRSPANLFQG